MFGRLCHVTRGALVGAFVLPHGALTLNPDPKADPKSYKLQKAMQKCGEEIKSLKPDIILLTTPHGISLNNALAIYTNRYASGSAEWLGQWKEYALNIELDVANSYDLIKWINASTKAENRKYHVDGLRFIYQDFEVPIKWGEVIPLWNIRDILIKHKRNDDWMNKDDDDGLDENDNEKEAKTKVIIMSHRLANVKYDMDPTNINDLNDLRFIGEQILDWSDNLNERVVIIISGDLAHKHRNDIDQRYAASDYSQPFDDLIEEWMKTTDSKYLNNAGSIERKAGSCGFYGFLILDGILQKWMRINPLKPIKNQILCPPTHPTYYGMTVASFLLE